MITAILVLAAADLTGVLIVIWVLAKIRDDQLLIRQFIAHEIRAKRGDRGAPTDDEGFLKWLQEHPNRPNRDDPPMGRPR